MLDLILVNGLPGSGKTTLAAELAKALEASLISKDAIKEAVADIAPGVPFPTLGVAASEMMWALAAGMAGDVVLESWWFKPRDLSFVQAGLRRCSPASVVEVWCDVPPHLAKSRYAARKRHRLHDDERRLAEAWPRWEREAEPLAIAPVIPVDTSGTIDLPGVVARVRQART